ncbi:hypothetical protein RU07_15470 [Agrobacterium tumefaciens]|uniref:PAS domain-containing protein n=1 Tax=Agrobacterium tumefaciens TaxID=358 RepID=A0A0D0KPA8_AGRTU|nr:hypothetical protein RU07_15470 [Agrobacterium tumefaciens]
MLENNQIQRYVAISNGGFYAWDVCLNLFWADENFARITGLEPDELNQGLPAQRMLDLIHEDDRPHVSEGIKNSVLSGEPFQMVYRVRRGDGFAKITEVGRCYRYIDGVASLFTGVVFDSTTPARSEDASNGNIPVLVD